MGDVPIFVSVQGSEQLKRLSRDLKGAPRELRLGLRKQIRDAGKPVVADLRRATLAVDVRAPGGDQLFNTPTHRAGLRSSVARATGLSQTTRGIRIRVSNSLLAKTHPPNLAKYLDGTLNRYRTWRHPVYGNREVWVQQFGEPYFFVTIRKHTKTFRRACFKAMEDTAARIAK